MSRTYKLIRYNKGAPIYSRHINEQPLYNWIRKEDTKARRSIYRAFRKEQKQFFQKFGEYLKFQKTNGWKTW